MVHREMIDPKEIALNTLDRSIFFALALSTLSKLSLQENKKTKPPHGGIPGGDDPHADLSFLGLGIDLGWGFLSSRVWGERELLRE